MTKTRQAASSANQNCAPPIGLGWNRRGAAKHINHDRTVMGYNMRGSSTSRRRAPPASRGKRVPKRREPEAESRARTVEGPGRSTGVEQSPRRHETARPAERSRMPELADVHAGRSAERAAEREGICDVHAEKVGQGGVRRRDRHTRSPPRHHQGATSTRGRKNISTTAPQNMVVDRIRDSHFHGRYLLRPKRQIGRRC